MCDFQTYIDILIHINNIYEVIVHNIYVIY